MQIILDKHYIGKYLKKVDVFINNNKCLTEDFSDCERIDEVLGKFDTILKVCTSLAKGIGYGIKERTLFIEDIY